MYIKQITVFVENRSGRLSEILDTLAQNHIDISALSLADTTDFGLLRMIVNQPDEAIRVLKEQGVIAKVTDVLAIAVNDTAGGLSNALKILSGEGLAVEYMYAFVGKSSSDALVVIRTDDQKKASDVCEKHGIRTISAERAYKY